MPRRKPKEEALTPAQVDDVVEQYKAGTRVREIAAQYDRSAQAIYWWLDQREVPRRGPRFRRETLVAEVTNLLEAKTSPHDIVSRLGYKTGDSLARCLRRAERYDLARRFDALNRSRR